MRVSLENEVDEASSWRASSSGGGTPGMPPGEAPLTFAEWQELHFPGMAQQGPVDDPDLDGWANLAEYALGGDPCSATDFPEIRISGEDDGVTLRYPNVPNRLAVIGIEISDDLVDWQVLDQVGTITADGGQSIVAEISNGRVAAWRYVRFRISEE